jgi:uncharacterized delta-60 repeat protein
MVLADSSFIGAGYSNTPGLASTQPVIYRLTPAGDLDEEFGSGGVFHQIILPSVTEVYGIGLQANRLVTAGYGRASAEAPTDWVSLGITLDGQLDTKWGTGGATQIDVGFADNNRSLAVLPDQRVLLVGSGEAEMGVKDAMIAVLGADGAPDTTFGPEGFRLYDLGGGGDAFWGAAVAPGGDHVVVVGFEGKGMAASTEDNDDAAILFVPLSGP